jgi:hypothetical protein
MTPSTLLRATLLGAILLGGLTACGGSDHDAPPPAAPAPPPPPVAVGTPDPFVTLVAGVVANSPDDAEPASFDATVPTMPEITEPAPLP